MKDPYPQIKTGQVWKLKKGTTLVNVVGVTRNQVTYLRSNSLSKTGWSRIQYWAYGNEFVDMISEEVKP